MAIDLRSEPGATPRLVIYLTVGDPDLETTRDIALAALDAGADVLELGVPFSDPVADGPVIQRASERSLARGTRLKDVLALAAELRRLRPRAGLVIFSYLNPVLRFGLEAFCPARRGVRRGWSVADRYDSGRGGRVPCLLWSGTG